MSVGASDAPKVAIINMIVRRAHSSGDVQLLNTTIPSSDILLIVRCWPADI